MIIARAEEKDLERILRIQRQAYQSEAKLYGDSTIPPLRQTLEELRVEFRLKVFLKAVLEGKLLGSVRVSLSERTCLVERLIVDPAAQGRGIGSALLSAAEAVYPDVRSMELFTGARSEQNLKFYEKRGYVRSHEKVLSERVTLVFLRKTLLPNPRGAAAGGTVRLWRAERQWPAAPDHGVFGERKPMKTRSDIAVEKFLAGFNCAQAVLYSFCDDLHFDRDKALRLACGFGAGMARKQEVCGAITGGILTIGLKHGRGEGQDRTPTEETYRKVRELTSRFESKHGTCNCRTLLKGCDLNTPEGQRYFQENDLLNKTCKGCVKTVVETLGEIL